MYDYKRGKIMENDLILEIDDVGPIYRAKIEIGKINIIGGKNSTGKSTCSKLLYCFLRANSPNSNELVKDNLYQLMGNIIRNLQPYVDIKLSAYENGEYFEELYYFRRIKEIGSIIRRSRITKNEINMNDLMDYAVTINHVFTDLNSIAENNPRFIYIKEDIESMNETIDNIINNPDYMYLSILKELIDSEFNIINDSSNFGYSATLKSENLNFKDSIDFSFYEFSHNQSFPIEEIYYLDSFSLFDIQRRGITQSDHVKNLSRSLNERYSYKAGIYEKRNKKISDLEKQISILIDGKINQTTSGYEYVTSGGIRSIMQNTASGIKQIGIIQKLLSNNKLIPGSFLIIDEPEVNLHPEWQVKFAQILVLLASELDITIYINTHSPMFIEAMTLYSEYYDLLDETNVYLTEEDDTLKDFPDLLEENDVEVGKLYRIGIKYTFKKINPKNMGAVYENLSRPYDDLDDLKSDILNKKIAKG